MISITFPDGNKKEYEEGKTPIEIISEDIGEGLAKAALAAEFNSEIIDLTTPLETSGNLRIITYKDDEGKDIFKHSGAHILAMAVKRIFPEAKLTIGPSVEDGFYYDIDYKRPFAQEDINKLEEEIKKIINENIPFKRKNVSKEEALKIFSKNEFKKEMISDLGDNQMTIYENGDFKDLCKGPHVPSTGKVKCIKLMKISGAFWRGDAKNKQLQRIYGVAFPDKKELKQYLEFLKEAEKRDHRKIGRDMDLFCFSDLVGPGLPLFTPKGTIMKDTLQKEVENICYKYGFEKVITPHLSNIELYNISGHATKFSEELFHVTSQKGHKMVMKPVQCPHQTQIYASRSRSYRDLPIRYMESEKQYRAEMSGAVSGLSRVYAITCEDGHSFCRVDQVKQEIKNMVQIIKDFYSALGLWGNHWVSLSLRDYESPEKYIGETEDWDKCEKMLQEVSDEMGLDAKRCEGEAALYGPKLDFMFKDAMGKEIQIPTVQVDFATPKRFNLTYISQDNTEKHPVMVHRAILGSYERFFVLLIEHFAGKFPLWLAPVQVKLLPIADRHMEHCLELKKQMEESGLRVEINSKAETMNKKVREAQLENVPLMITIGDKEQESSTLAIRTLSGKVKYGVTVNDFLENTKKLITNRSLESYE
ncbi:MAG: threonine--tRNA ligase [Nanobdellota archaeon]